MHIYPLHSHRSLLVLCCGRSFFSPSSLFCAAINRIRWHSLFDGPTFFHSLNTFFSVFVYRLIIDRWTSSGIYLLQYRVHNMKMDLCVFFSLIGFLFLRRKPNLFLRWTNIWYSNEQWGHCWFSCTHMTRKCNESVASLQVHHCHWSAGVHALNFQFLRAAQKKKNKVETIEIVHRQWLHGSFSYDF